MAKFTTAIELDIALKNADEIENAKLRMRELRKVAMEAVQAFGEFSPEAQKAKQAFAEVKDQVADFNEQVSALNPDKFERINTVVQAGTRGFQAIAGATALFGKQSEELEKTLVQLQGVMALTEGLAGLGKMRNELKSIAGPIITQVTTAFKAFGTSVKATLISTGIGLFIVALGTIAAFWDDIKAAVSGVSKEQEDLLKKTQKDVDANKEKMETLNNQDNILKQQGKTEDEILQLKIQQQKAIITGLESQLLQQEQIKKTQIETAQRNKDILQGIIRFLFAPLSLLLKAVDEVGKALGQDFGLEEGFSGGIAKLVFDPEAIKKESEEALKETKKQLNSAKNTLAGFEIQRKDISKKGAEDINKQNELDAKKALDKRKAEAQLIADEQKKEIALLKISQEERAKEYKALGLKKKEIEELNQREIDDVNKKYQDKADAIAEKKKKDGEEQTKTLVERLKAQEDAINDVILTARDKELRASQDRFDALIEQAKKNGDNTKALEEAKAKAISDIKEKYGKEDADKTKKREEDLQQFIIDMAKQGLQALIDLNDASAGTSEESRKKAFENNKKLGIAMAIIDTYSAASKAYASQIIVGDPSSIIRAQIAAGMAIAGGIVRVKKISETNFESKGISSSSTGGSPSALAPQGFTRPKGVEELFTQDRKVYVLESDITMTQERNKRNKSLSIVE